MRSGAIEAQVPSTSSIHPQRVAVVPPSLRASVISGSAWTLGAFATSQVLRLGSNLILVWLLVPEAFGLMLLVNMVMQGLQMFSDIGIGPSIIQNERGNDPKFLNTAWTIQIIRGVVLWCCASVLAWPLAWAFSQNDPSAWQLLHLIPTTALMAIIAGFFSTGLYTLNRHLAMGRISIVQVCSQVSGIMVMIIWALMYPSVWALVAGGLVSHLCKLILSHTVINTTRNKIAWDWQCVTVLVHFGKWITLSTAIAFLALQADRILLGNLVPLEVLGVYSLGLMLATLPREVLVHLTGLVLFPALSQHGRAHRQSLHEKVYMARAAIVPLASILVLGVVLLAPAFFELLYPEVFHDAGWMAQLVSVSIWFVILAALSDRALLAVGNSRALAIGNVINLLLAVPSALICYAMFGIGGLILGYATGSLANLMIMQRFMAREGIPVLRDDVFYTLIVVTLAAVGLAFQSRLAYLLSGPVLSQFIVGLVILGGVSIWAVCNLIPQMRRS